MNWNRIKLMLQLKAAELITSAELEGLRLLKTTGQKLLGADKREQVEAALLVFIEQADNTIPGMDLPPVDAIEKTLVHEAIDLAWGKLGDFVNSLSQPLEQPPVEETPTPPAEPPVTNAPELKPGGAE